ncbi:hypothetical protein GCM10022278_07980 [Allohahella marinimesophila]|uniref:Uncharacterized protein n=1 Tax=Allohahella marinimesophila TaxID=1054972 RepID=A0ABP7NP12_9GAMM
MWGLALEDMDSNGKTSMQDSLKALSSSFNSFLLINPCSSRVISINTQYAVDMFSRKTVL